MRGNKRFSWGLLTGFAALLLGFLSCTKYEDPAPFFEEYGVDTSAKATRKVLFINIAGAVGQEMEAIAPPNMMGLLDNAKYTWAGKSDANSTDVATWASMMTGVSSGKHKLIDSTFMPAFDGNDQHGEISFNPTFIYRMLVLRPEMDVTAITSWQSLANTLLIDATTKIVAADDKTVADSAIARLKSGDAAATIVDFNEVNRAGIADSFSATSETYKNAVLKVDGYVGQLLEALKSRKSYASEEWLVIISSNHGGNANGYGGSSPEERNTFGIFYYPKFEPLKMIPNSTNAVRMHGSDPDAVKAVLEGNQDQYNIGNGALTISLKVKLNPNADGGFSYSYPPFLSKTEARTGNTEGWSFFKVGNNIAFWAATGSEKIEISGAAILDNEWHTVTGVIYKEENTYYAKLYLDGQLSAEGSKEVPAGATIASTFPLTLGYNPTVFSDQFIDFYANDVRIWNTALPADAVLELACMSDIPDTYQYSANLIGYWPCNEGMSDVLKNKVGGAPSMKLQGDYAWQLFGDQLPCSYTNTPESTLFKNVDISTQILYWLRIPVKSEWGLEGSTWLKKFELEFL